MKITLLKPTDNQWEQVAEYARNCSWRAGENLAQRMDNHEFSDWERVIVAQIEDKIVGFCIVSKTDCIPDVAYMPYISYVFVDEVYRGNRISEKLCQAALQHLQQAGFGEVYLVSGEQGLYEKYGFVKIDEKQAFWGDMQSIFCYAI